MSLGAITVQKEALLVIFYGQKYYWILWLPCFKILFARQIFVMVVNISAWLFTFGLECGALCKKKQTMPSVVHPTDVGGSVTVVSMHFKMPICSAKISKRAN